MRSAGQTIRSFEQNAGERAVGHALAGIAGGDMNTFAARIAADEAAVVDGVEHLSRPAIDFFAELRHERADPGLDRFEAHIAVIGLAGFVVGAAGDQIVGRAGPGLRRT